MIISDINYISDVSGEVLGGSKKGGRGDRGGRKDVNINVSIIKQTAYADAYVKGKGDAYATAYNVAYVDQTNK